MKTTIPKLRRTIRRILLENHQHFEKLVTLMLTGEQEYVVQAIELAEALEYISTPRYTNETDKFGRIHHSWSCNANDQGFYDELETRYQIATGERIYGNFFMSFWPDELRLGIGFVETPEGSTT